MQQASQSYYYDSVKKEGSNDDSSSSPPGDNPDGQAVLLEEDDSDQLNFYQNKCKRKKKRKLEIIDLNVGRWNLEQKKSFHLLLEVSFRTFINRMVFKKNFKLFARRKQFFTMRSHSQTRTFMQKAQRRHNRNFIQILATYRQLFYNSLNPEFVQNQLSKRKIESEKILTIQQLQKLFLQTKQLKKYMIEVRNRQTALEQALIEAKKLKQQQQKKQQEKKKEKQALVLKDMMEKFDPKRKKSKQNDYVPKKSKIICFTMDPITFEIINQTQVEE